jgi:Flp pilus assembly protein TadD
MSTVSVSQAFSVALQHHKAGRLAEAEALYRQILAVQPNHAGTLQYLGVLAHQVGRNDLAVEWMRQAIALTPNDASAHSNIGTAYHAMSRLEEAITSFRRAIELQPTHAEAHHNLGVALTAAGRPEEAVAAYRRAIHCKPDYADAHNNLGVLLADKGQFDEAIAIYRAALDFKPNNPDVLNNLGNALKARGRIEEATAAYRRALDLKPDSAEAHTNLGTALCEQGRLDEAVAAHQRALELKPDYAGALSNLGIALRERGQLDEAMAACQKALTLTPNSAEAQNNLGNVLKEFGRLDEATTAYRQALQINSALGEAQFNYSYMLLLRGDFEQGWPLYEARCHEPGYVRRDFGRPLWTGGSVSGRRILVHTEQGFGDAIQFVRYAALIPDRGGEVVIECPTALVDLFRTATGVSEVVAKGDPLPAFDLHSPMLSLPLAFQTRSESIPREVPYLFPDAGRVETWRARLGDDSRRRRVGLAWMGNPKTHFLRKRHIPLSELLPILSVEDVEFYSLQIGPGVGQIRETESAAAIVDCSGQINDFADTAALMMKLDLIISVDTAVAHLAGALGRPVWTLLPFVPDWRWGLETEETPWYRTMRLFRQASPDDWGPVVRRVAEELRGFHPSQR